MKRFIFALTALLTVAGCATPQPNPTAPVLTIWDASYTKKNSYKLFPEGEKLLEDVLAKTPNHNINDPVDIDLSAVIVVDGLKYAVEQDRVLLPGDRFTKIWNQKGIREELIDNSLLLKPSIR